VIGGGFIGLEFGFALARAGMKVTLLQSGPQIGPALDQDIRNALLECANEAGMTIKTNVKVTKIEGDRTVEAEIDGRKETFFTDQVLLATGRQSNVESMKPERANIDLDHGAVKVNEYLQSVSATHVYAAGDAAGKHQHSPVAWYEGPIAAVAIIGGLKKSEVGAMHYVFPTFGGAIFDTMAA